MDDELKLALALFAMARERSAKANAASAAAMQEVRDAGGEFHDAKKRLDAIINKMADQILKEARDA